MFFGLIVLLGILAREYLFKMMEKLRGAFARRHEETEAVVFLEGMQACFRAGLDCRAALRSMRERRRWNGSCRWTLAMVVDGCAQGMSLNESIAAMLREQRAGSSSPQLRCFWMVLQTMNRRGGNTVDLSGAFLKRVREAHGLRRRVNSLLAQIRLQSLAVQISPLLVLWILALVSWEKVTFLFTTVPGALVLLVALILHVVGTFVLRRLERWSSISKEKR